jgi:glucokinase
MTMQGRVLGLDIGGTKLAAGVCTEEGKLVSSGRALTDAALGPDAVITRAVSLAKEVAEKAGLSLGSLQAVGVGCVGAVEGETGVIVSAPNLPGWHQVPLGARLAQALGRRVFVENDAKAAALGEHRFGAGQGVRNSVYLTLSTGIGGGLIVEHRLWRGANGNAGELGHSTVAFDGRLCKCGNRGCLEAYASGTHIAARARERLAAGEPSTLGELAGGIDRVTSATVVEGVRQADPLSLSIWEETLAILAAGLANVVNIFNPERIILGGGVTRAGPLLFEPLRDKVAARALPQLMKVVSIVPAMLGDDVGVYGAAAVAFAHLASGG